jgi:hypothetical protein
MYAELIVGYETGKVSLWCGAHCWITLVSFGVVGSLCLSLRRCSPRDVVLLWLSLLLSDRDCVSAVPLSSPRCRLLCPVFVCRALRTRRCHAGTDSTSTIWRTICGERQCNTCATTLPACQNRVSRPSALGVPPDRSQV